MFGPRSMQRINLEGWLAGLQERPIALQFIAMDLSPRLDKALLRSREIAADAFDGIQRKDRAELVVHRVKVRPMMRRADFGEQTMPSSTRQVNPRAHVRRRGLDADSPEPD